MIGSVVFTLLMPALYTEAIAQRVPLDHTGSMEWDSVPSSAVYEDHRVVSSSDGFDFSPHMGVDMVGGKRIALENAVDSGSGTPVAQNRKRAAKVYSYEHVKERGRGYHYQIFMSGDGANASREWESSNTGFAIKAGSAPATDFPVQQCKEGYQGSCAKLMTLSTGTFGKVLNMPLASGSLFLGEIKTINLLVRPLKGTRFGVPYKKNPIAVGGYYKYKSGEVYIDKYSKPVKGKRDIFDLYAVFYEVTDDLQVLDGTNVTTHPNIVSIGSIADARETDEWTYFEFEMVPKEGKVIDQEKLANGGYKFAIVISASTNGGKFEGAAGSTLLIDEIKVYFE